jgi:hypothetical protein
MSALEGLFLDCHRRAGIQKSRDGAVDLVKLWAGLGFTSEFKGRAREFFEPIHGERPRVMGWYRLTEAGRAEYLRRHAAAPDYFDRCVA